ADDQAGGRHAEGLDRGRAAGPHDHHAGDAGRSGTNRTGCGVAFDHQESIPSLAASRMKPVTSPSSAPVVTFDAGQTLIDLDLAFLARRLAERGLVITPAALAAAAPAAWRRYDALVDPAAGHPWHALMATLLGGAGVAEAAIDELVAWLWAEQPRANLW